MHSRRLSVTSEMFARGVAILGVTIALAFSLPSADAAKPEVNAVADEDCGQLGREGGYGPWDYTNPDFRQPAEVKIVESYHFTPKVEALISGESALLGGDIGYTLNVWPNHHRALMSMANLAIREKKAKPAGARYTIECYFDRARRMNPNDGMVDLIYAIYESRLGRWEDALKDAKKAEQQLPESRDVHYNLGLIYLNLKDYPNAREHAKKAYALGHQLPGLRQKLQAAKQWDE